MKHELELKNLGPIAYCQLSITPFTVLTGPQSQGKSTIAKAIYFARTLKQDIWEIISIGSPALYCGLQNATWEKAIRRKLKEKFMDLYGSSQAMPKDMELSYTFCEGVSISVKNQDDFLLNICFGDALRNYFSDLDARPFYSMTEEEKRAEHARLCQLLNDPYETIFIPAGRSLITLLSEQLGYLFSSLDSRQLRNIDYVTRRYVSLIQKLRPSFSNGIVGCLSSIPFPASIVREMTQRLDELLAGKYRYVDGEDRLYLTENRFLKLKFASSGQQEIVWILNILFYYLLTEQQVFLLLEEPESHLFPEAQRQIGEILGLFHNSKNEILVTTHSPYLLGTFNYMLQAGQCEEGAEDAVKEVLHRRCWLKPENTEAFFVENGRIRSVIDREDSLILIENEVIDEASLSINKISDAIMEANWAVEDENGEIV